MKKLKEYVNKLFQGRYGLDELGKMLIGLSLVLYILGIALQSEFIFAVSLLVLIFSLYRIFSRQNWDRGEENRKYMNYIKLWKLKYEHRESARIYMCKRCGKYIRVPKGKGKIQVTCTACGDKTIRRT